MTLRGYLLKQTKKRITKKDISEYLKCWSDKELYDAVNECGDILKPVKNSGTNGSYKYPLYDKYTIVKPEKDYSEINNEIDMLDSRLLKTDILHKKPEKYEKYRDKIKLLSRYLQSENLKGCQEVSKKERSFEIFGHEKVLDDKSFVNLLDELGFDKSILSYYETPELCFFDYISRKKAEMTLLISENKDAWFNIRRLMFESGIEKIFNINIDGAVYGCGNSICGEGALKGYTDFLGVSSVNYLYWGDIDREGLKIYQRLKEKNSDCKIGLFLPAYEKMLRLAADFRHAMPDSDDERGLEFCFDDVLSVFALKDREYIIRSLNENKRIPQEIVSYVILKQEAE